ncbi:MAG: hypothetical protein DRI61_01195 [Chloroflexi bacterium]|nr:MAG: hypothetical protein DRI61_01195 [Chloroflexota bacterium]
MIPWVRTYRHLGRYREIIGILLKYGIDNLMEQLGLRDVFSFPRFRRVKAPELRLSAPERVRMALEELGPTFIKLGQIMSTRPDLIPPAYIRELAKLQDTVPPSPWEAIQEVVEGELGASLEKIFAKFNPEPIAAASLAQVHEATLYSGDEVVVKIQRPNIEKIIEEDLDILAELAQLASRTSLGEIYDLEEIVDEFAFTLRNELNYIREGRNADRFRENFAGEKFLYIPRIYWDYTTPRVLVLERISGIKIDDIEAIDAAGLDRHLIALNAARIIIKEVLEDGFFHADPHPGNFFVMDEGAIGAMDFGMVGHLTRQDRENLIRLYIFSVRMDAEGIVDQLLTIGAARYGIDRKALARDISRLLSKYYNVPLKYIRAREVMEEITPVVFRHKLRLPSQYWLLGKTLAMMEGIGLKLDPDFDIFAVSAPYVRRFMWQMVSPRTWGDRALKGLLEFGDLLTLLPRHLPTLVEQVERGQLGFNISLKEMGELVRSFQFGTNRLALSVLLAAFIIASALLIAAWPSIGQFNWGIWLLVAAFVLSAILGFWLLVSILLSLRH